MLPSHGRSRGFESLIAHHPPEIIAFRHGQTAWNLQGRFQGGALDSPLTDEGRAQATALGRALGALGVNPATHDALVSPQGRARATARLALSPLGLRARPDPRLREVGVGAWAGLSASEIGARWPGPEGEPLFAFYVRAPGGEGVDALAARVAGVIAGLTRPTVVVTHGITLRVLCALALGLPAVAGESIKIPQGCAARLHAGSLDLVEPAALASPRPGG